MSVEEAAQVLGIGRNGCYALVASGQLSVVRLGRRIVVPRQAIQHLLRVAATDGIDEGSPDVLDP